MSNTLRRKIEGFVYDHIQRFVDIVYEGGEDTVYAGVKVLDEPDRFVHGALLNANAALIAHYHKMGDERLTRAIDAFKINIGYILNSECKSWGELSVLKAICRLKEIGMLDIITEEQMETLKAMTDYDDFFDKDKLETKGYPTNYLRVAMACAGYREYLGWDEVGYSKAISDKLVSIIESSSAAGWMDEDPPYKRFDRYSIILTSEFADTSSEIGIELPEIIKNNLKIAAEYSIFMANEYGDGINYGRSLSCHGDAAPIEIISSAFAYGLVRSEMKDKALAYSSRVLDKILGYWYDSERLSFNLWWDGRSTNRYRQVQRVLELNLDMAIHLLVTLDNFIKGGVADDEIPEISFSTRPLEYSKIEFYKEEFEASTYLIKLNGRLIMLPLIGLGKKYKLAAYCPYPAICGMLEGAPEADQPFLIPEYRLKDGTVARPIQYYTDISSEETASSLIIHAKGRLCDTKDIYPNMLEDEFSVSFVFNEEGITVTYSTDAEVDSVRMICGIHDPSHKLHCFGFESYSVINTCDEYDFKTPSGAIIEAREYVSNSRGTLGYRFYL